MRDARAALWRSRRGTPSHPPGRHLKSSRRKNVSEEGSRTTGGVGGTAFAALVALAAPVRMRTSRPRAAAPSASGTSLVKPRITRWRIREKRGSTGTFIRTTTVSKALGRVDADIERSVFAASALGARRASPRLPPTLSPLTVRKGLSRRLARWTTPFSRLPPLSAPPRRPAPAASRAAPRSGAAPVEAETSRSPPRRRRDRRASSIPARRPRLSREPTITPVPRSRASAPTSRSWKCPWFRSRARATHLPAMRPRRSEKFLRVSPPAPRTGSTRAWCTAPNENARATRRSTRRPLRAESNSRPCGIAMSSRAFAGPRPRARTGSQPPTSSLEWASLERGRRRARARVEDRPPRGRAARPAQEPWRTR